MCAKGSPAEGGSYLVQRIRSVTGNRSFWSGLGGHFGLDSPVILNRIARSFSTGFPGHFEPDYARHQRHPEQSSLQSVLRAPKGEWEGIKGGIDSGVWEALAAGGSDDQEWPLIRRKTGDGGLT